MSQVAAGNPASTPVTGRGIEGLDARRHRRARAHWAIRLTGLSQEIVSGWVCDVSEGGIGMLSTMNVPVGTTLRVALAVPHPADTAQSTAVQATVRVVFSAFVGTQSRLGLQFLALPMDARVAIRRYVIARS